MALDTTSYILGKKAGGGEEPTGTINITENGITNVKSYATADVNVQPNLESKEITITENTTTLIEPTTGKDGLSSVSITTDVSIPVPVEVESKDVDFYDYDGTRVYSYTRAEVQELTELPANPTHDGLIAQGWNWDLADIKSYSAEYKYNKVNVGQMYITDDGKTRIYITLLEGRTNPYLGVAVNGTATIDWGDGSEIQTITGTSWTSPVPTQHNYSQAGDYVIKLDGNYNIVGSQNSGSYILYDGSSLSSPRSKMFHLCINKIELGNMVNDAPSGTATNIEAFARMYSLKSITMPKDVVLSGSYIYRYSYGLNYICWNKNRNSNSLYPSNVFEGTWAKIISIPINLFSSNMNTNMFSSCSYLRSLTIPGNLHLLSNNLLSGTSSLFKISLPNITNSFSGSSFSNGSLKILDFSHNETVPALNSTISNFPTDCQIIVPDDLYDDWIVATNWSTYASQIVKASEVE